MCGESFIMDRLMNESYLNIYSQNIYRTHHFIRMCGIVLMPNFTFTFFFFFFFVFAVCVCYCVFMVVVLNIEIERDIIISQAHRFFFFVQLVFVHLFFCFIVLM